MRRSTVRLLLLLVSIPLLVVLFAFVYQQGMIHLEHEPRSLWASIEWAAETITTTGYGHDNEWHHPFMQGFVVGVQFIGVFLVFLIFPVFLIPFFEERFEGRLPKSLPKLKNHILIYRWGPEVTTLVEELDHARVPVVIFEEDAAMARRLHDRGRNVVLGNLSEDEPDLSTLQRAKGVVANGSDHANAVFVMSARQQGFEGTIVAMVQGPRRRNAMVRAGATAVFTPTHALAAAMAAKASRKITPSVSGAPMLGDKVLVGEIRIDANSELAGQTLASSKLGTRSKATVVGRWVDGDLVQTPPDTVLSPGSILVAVGSHDSMEALAQIAYPVPSTGPFVICGMGQLGRKVAQFLVDAGEEVVGIDAKQHDLVTHVGDALDPDLLSKAGVARAQAVITCLGDDSETVFACAVVRDLAPETIIIAAARRASNVARIHRAGADFGFSQGQVAGQLMAFQLLGRQSVTLQPQIKIVKAKPGSLVGADIPSSNVRGRTGCSVVAVERADDVHVDFDETFTIKSRDAIYVAGTEAEVARYLDLYDAE